MGSNPVWKWKFGHGDTCIEGRQWWRHREMTTLSPEWCSYRPRSTNYRQKTPTARRGVGRFSQIAQQTSGFLASGTMRQYISVVLSPPGWVLCYSSLRNLIQLSDTKYAWSVTVSGESIACSWRKCLCVAKWVSRTLIVDEDIPPTHPF